MREQIDFTDETVVVTGGASDVGAAVATEFATEGADVVIADIADDRGRAVVEDVEANHDVRAAYEHTDVSDLGSCEDLVDAVLDRFGSIDALVNAAAVAAPSKISKPFAEEGPEDWEPQLQVTLMGAVNPTNAALSALSEGAGGAVVNFSSEAHRGQDVRTAMYAAAKSGVVTFTQTLAKEIGSEGVRINAVSPSTTRTAATESFLDAHGDAILENHALDRLGVPADHANATLFLASDAAEWITGQVLSVNGGYL